MKTGLRHRGCGWNWHRRRQKPARAAGRLWGQFRSTRAPITIATFKIAPSRSDCKAPMVDFAPQRKTLLIEIPKLGQNGTAPQATIRRIAKSLYNCCLRPGIENRLWISAPQPPGAKFKVLGLRRLSLIVPPKASWSPIKTHYASRRTGSPNRSFPFLGPAR